MHAEAVVDYVELIGVDVQRGPLLGAADFGRDYAHALLERGTRIESAQHAVGEQ